MPATNGSSRFRPTLTPDSPGVQEQRGVANGMLLGFLLSWLPTPWRWLAVIPLASAIFSAVRGLRRAPRGREARILRIWLGVGLGACLMLLAVTITPLLASPWTADYRECMAGANTGVARAQCANDHGNWWTRLMGEDAAF